MRSRFLIPLLAVFAGCGDAPPEPPRVPAASISGTGVIRGVVRFDGTPPERKTVRNDPCCPGSPATLLDETVVVDANGMLANVFVYLEDGPKTEGTALPAPVLDQKFCQYVPHAIGVVVGQPLTLKSSDATMHNVAIYPTKEPAKNYSMKTAGETSVTSFAQTGFATSKCDVHPWMKAVIGVFDNPYFAVTAADGSYEITGVPDGTYTLVARHEQYLYAPSGRQTVTIRGGQAVTADFRYHPPKS